jgi:hypothetical protein
MSGPVEEIGARLTLRGRAEFLRGVAEARKEIASVGKTTETTDARILASNKAVQDAQANLAAKSAEYAALREKQARLVALAAEQEAGAVRDALLVEADAMGLATRAAREQQAAAAASLRAARESARGIALANTEMAASTEASASRFARAMTGLTKFGKVATLGLVAGAALVGVASVRAAGNFQQSMTLVQTMAGVSHDRIASLSKGLLNMAPGVAAGPTALADALYRISSANSGLGATNTQLLAMTKAAAQLNLIGGGNDSTLGETARVLGGVRASNIKGAGGYQNIVSLAAATVGSGDMKMGDFINALGTGVLPAAANYGVKLPDVGALLSVLTDNLIPGSTAGNVMAHMFSLMGGPTGPAQKAFKAIGLHPTDLNYAMRNKGLIPILIT